MLRSRPLFGRLWALSPAPSVKVTVINFKFFWEEPDPDREPDPENHQNPAPLKKAGSATLLKLFNFEWLMLLIKCVSDVFSIVYF